ncbi:MAG: FAD-dependent oxidoreductase [Lentisphaerae bacterium]|nr:FAD-dependent oxidoreductase [Lentisphaerota bacterium]
MANSPSSQWRCLVCNYVHTGAEPPAGCPVCGTGAGDFVAHDAPTTTAAAVPTVWRCLVCGYIHEGNTPPAACLICGAETDCFQAQEEKQDNTTAMPAVNVAIIGSGIAGIAAAEAARNASPTSAITLFSAECELPYYRLNLTRLLAGEITPEALPIHPQTWYDERHITLRCSSPVASINPSTRSLTLADGTTSSFDSIVLTAGAHPFVPPLEGTSLDGVFSLRTTDDANAILQRLAPDLPCVCIGGGVLGIETAAALARRGADVTLLESHDWLMPRQLNDTAASLLERHLNHIGVKVMINVRSQALEGGDTLEGVRLTDGRLLPARLAILATGVRPNTAIARKAGLDVNKGVTVDATMATSAPGIYAAGDDAEYNGLLYGTWAASQAQGAIAGFNAAGGTARFVGLPRSNTIKAVGLDLTSIGRFQPEDGSDVVVENELENRYTCFVFRDNRMIGALLIGHTELAAPTQTAIENGTDFSLLMANPDCEQIIQKLTNKS